MIDLVAGATNALELRVMAGTKPLAAARLWHPKCETCRRPLRFITGRGPHDFTCVNTDCDDRHDLVEASSQRYPLSKLAAEREGHVEDSIAIFGGNGAGKTYFVAQLAVAVAIGRENPDVAEWVRANGIDPQLVPPLGGLVIASSLTSALSRDTLRKAIAEFVPPGSKWKNQHGDGQAEVTPAGAVGLGKIVFKSNDQGREKYQGYAAALVILDEEHDLDVYEECLERTSRVRWEGRSGYIVLSMTPLKGFTWVHRVFVAEESRDAGTRAAWIWGENNPYLDHVARKRKLERKSLSGAMRAARDRGVFGVPSGLVYRSWSRHVHVIEPFRPPTGPDSGWFWFEGIDFGDRNPFSYGLYAFDSHDNRLYRVAEWYKRETLLSEHAAQIKRIRAEWGVDPRRVITIADPAQAGQRRSLALEHGIGSSKAKKDLRLGIEACQERLRYGAAVEAGFYVFNTCRHFVAEIEGYRWAESKTKTDQKELPLKRDDHAMDEWRYVCVKVARMAA